MKKTKKLLSVFLAMTLLLVSIPFCSLNAQAADDYPAEYKNAAQDAKVDRWNFYNRECTSFVAWCLNSRNGVAFTNWYGGRQWGNAKDWGTAAKALGITVNNTPAKGAVYWSNAGFYGHVAWVSEVNGNKVTIEEYNGTKIGAYSSRTIQASNATGYIHIKDIPTVPQGKEISSKGKLADPGDYYIASAVGNDMLLDVGGNPNQIGKNVKLFHHLHDTQQVWHVSYVGGFYRFVDHDCGGALDVEGNSLDQGANVQVWDCNNGLCQDWVLTDAGDGYYYIQSRRNGWYLDVYDGNNTDNTNVRMWEGNQSIAQKWKLVKYEEKPEGEAIAKPDETEPAQESSGHTQIDTNGWTLYEDLPEGAMITDEKWTYIYTKPEETTTSRESSLPGWVQTGTEQQKTGNGEYYYVSFPSGFDTANTLYGKYQKKAMSSSGDKKVTGDSVSGYIYWHWTHSKGVLPNNNYNVLVEDKKTAKAIYFTAFESKDSYAHKDPDGHNGGECFYHWRNTPADGSWWWFRTDVHKQTYDTYETIYTYKKEGFSEERESYKEVSGSDTVSNIKHWVKYILKPAGEDTSATPPSEPIEDSEVTVAPTTKPTTKPEESKAPDVQYNIPSDSISYKGHAYKIYDTGVTWTEAERLCEENGGHLVTIGDKAENDWIISQLPENRKNCYWIGLYKDGTWKWIDQSKVSFTNWATQEPNNYEGEGEIYAHICGKLYDGRKKKNIGEWNDTKNEGAAYADKYFALENYGYICEWDIGSTEGDEPEITKAPTIEPTESSRPMTTEVPMIKPTIEPKESREPEITIAPTTEPTESSRPMSTKVPAIPSTSESTESKEPENTMVPTTKPTPLIEEGKETSKYKVYDLGMTWSEAVKYCESIGGHLATITSDAEQEKIVELIKETGNRNSYWLGGYRTTDGGWSWITDEKFEYANWGYQQPDNNTLSSSNGENKLMMYKGENWYSGLGDWNDLYETGTCGSQSFFGLDNFGFVCEWEDDSKDGGDPDNNETDKPMDVEIRPSAEPYSGTDVVPEPSPLIIPQPTSNPLPVASSQNAVPGTTTFKTPMPNVSSLPSKDDEEDVLTITLDTKKEILYTGFKYSVTATVESEDYDESDISWTSSDPNIAKVNDEGVITGVSKGTAVISATIEDVTARVKVIVKTTKIKLKNGTKSVSSVTVKKRTTAVFQVESIPEDIDIKVTGIGRRTKKIASISLDEGQLTVKGKRAGRFIVKLKYKKTTKQIKIIVK